MERRLTRQARSHNRGSSGLAAPNEGVCGGMATRAKPAAGDLLARAGAVLGATPPDAEAALAALVELYEGEREERARRLEALARVQTALARLRSVSTVDRILRL